MASGRFGFRLSFLQVNALMFKISASVYTIVASLALAATLSAQAPAVPVEKPAAPAAAKVEALSDTEKAAIDLLSVMAQRDQALKDLGQCSAALVPLQAQIRDAQLRARADTLRQAIEKAHAGYQWDIEKGTLVPVAPKVAKAEPKKD